MKISIVIPNRNGGDYLHECLSSVTAQTGVDIEVIVMDAASTDMSLPIIRAFEDKIAHWESAPDAGPYHAIERGMAKASGDILCWLNSDDILLPGALAEVASLFQKDPDMDWVSGSHSSFLELGLLHERGYNKRDFFFCDDTRYAIQQVRSIDHMDMTLDYILNDAADGGYFLQQESTFWRRELWETVGGFDHRYQLAADYWLWLEFLKLRPLTLVDRPFGSFRQTPKQRSVTGANSYRDEAKEIARRFQAQAQSNRTSAKASANPITVKRVIRDELCLATSIAPVEIEKQAFCMKTWTTQGARILSFNTADEIATIKAFDSPNLSDVEFVEVYETARAATGKDLVLLRDIIEHLAQFDDKTCLGIMNSDIMIDVQIDLLGFVRRTLDTDHCLISSRVDVEDFWDREGDVFSGGLDAFFFRAPMLSDFPMTAEFAIGAPWWDYFMPLVMQQAGIPIAYPRPLPFFHKKHTTNYPTSVWIHYGTHFLEYLDPDLAAAMKQQPGAGNQTSFLADIARQFAIEFYHRCTPVNPVPWSDWPPYGNRRHGHGEILKSSIQQWAKRAILAEEILQSRHLP